MAFDKVYIIECTNCSRTEESDYKVLPRAVQSFKRVGWVIEDSKKPEVCFCDDFCRMEYYE